MSNEWDGDLDPRITSLNKPMESPQTCAEIIEQMEAITNESVSIAKKVSELTEAELWEQCALVQKWYKSNLHKTFSDGWDAVSVEFWHDEDANNTGYSVSAPDEVFDEPFDDYQPTADTVEGRSQCLALMRKFGIAVMQSPEGEFYIIGRRDIPLSGDYQRIACEAVIMSVKGEEVEL